MRQQQQQQQMDHTPSDVHIHHLALCQHPRGCGIGSGSSVRTQWYRGIGSGSNFFDPGVDNGEAYRF